MGGKEAAKKLYQVSTKADIRPFLRFFEDGFQGTCLILKILRNAGQLTAGEIAKRLDVSTARVAAALNSLEKKGCVERLKSATDGRMVVVRLTASGRAALESREEQLLAMIGRILGKLTEEELLSLLHIIEKLVK